MNRKQLTLLYLCNLILRSVNFGSMPLLPLLAMEHGGDFGDSGSYMAIAFLSMASGAALAGWLVKQIGQARSMLIVVALCSTLAIALVGQAQDITQLMTTTAIAWFGMGACEALCNILTGHSASQTARRRAFGLMSTTATLGSLIGGLTMGTIAQIWGYPILFGTVAIAWIGLPVAALFLPEDRIHQPAMTSDPHPRNDAGSSVSLGMRFWLVMLSAVLAGVVAFVTVMGRSLVMDGLGFEAGSISSAMAIGSAVALPLPLMLGWLADRKGSAMVIALCYLFGFGTLVLLVHSTLLWHFWLVSLLFTTFTAYPLLGSAWVVELAPRRCDARAISMFNSSIWIGGGIGLTGAGYAFQQFGITETLFGSLLLIGLALLFLGMVAIGRWAVKTRFGRRTETDGLAYPPTVA